MSIKEVLYNAKRKKKQAQTIDTAKKVGMGLGIGAAIGSALGVLFAPKSGKETRKDITDTAKDTVVNIKESAGEMGEKISKIVEEGKERIVNIKKDKSSENEAAAEGEKCCDDNESCCGGCEEISTKPEDTNVE
jgi:gas vesicle protein